MKIDNGKHKIRFSEGKLYLDEVQIAGEGITPPKDVVFEFNVDKPKEEAVSPPDPNKDSSILEINVSDKIAQKDIGPGQG